MIASADGAAVSVPPHVLLTPSPAGVRGVQVARTMRLALRGDVLTVTWPDGRLEVLCGASDVRRVVHVGGREPQWIVGTRSSAWALPEVAWSPGWAGDVGWGKDPSHTGVARLAEAIGVRPKYVGEKGSVTPAGAGVRVVPLDPRPGRPWPLSLAALLCVASWICGVPALVVTAVLRHSPPAWAVNVIGLALLLTPVAWLMIGGLASVRTWSWRRRFAVPPRVPEGVVLRPVPAGRAMKAFATNCWLLVSPAEIAVRTSSGVEAWLPGPASGGVQTVALIGEAGVPGNQLQLCSADGTGHVALPVADWAGTSAALEAALAAFRAAGLEVAHEPSKGEGWCPPGLTASPNLTELRRHRPHALPPIDVPVPTFLSLVVWMHAIGDGVTVW